MIGVTTVAPLDGYRLRIGFTDGTERVVNVERSFADPFSRDSSGRAAFEAVTNQA